jgi:DNA-binding MarR family transcriptional regulator
MANNAKGVASHAKGDGLVDPLENLLGYQLRRASIIIMDDLYDTLTEVDLSPAVASVLMVIEANPNVKLIQVGRCLGIKRANMTPIIANLEKRGLVARTAVDGRSHALTLTEEGAEIVSEVHRLIKGHEQRCLGYLDDSAQRDMRSFLHAVRRWSIE